MNRDDIIRMAREAGFKASVGKTDKDGVYHPDVNAIGKDVPIEWVERLVQAAYAAGAAAEREACADKTGEFARKWWSIHCASNKHMETTRKAHDDFCALQAAIRARGNT